MSYKVIARKWRPQTFAEVVGQRHVTQTLENAIQANRVAHAYIFAGSRGVGKTTTARILAKALNCVKGPTATPCNVCDSCREIAAGTSLDVLEIDAASNRGIDQIRELREMVRYVAAGGRYKVVILDEAHQLTGDASNALLKTLEEPPDRVVFVLATTQPEELEDTIKSRAQLFQFRALSFAEIAGAIERIAAEEKIKIDSAAVAVLSRAAEGSLRDALSLLEQAMAYCGDTISDAQVRELLGVVAEDVLDALVAAIVAQSAEQALALVHTMIADGQNLQHFCREAIRHFRNLLVARVCGGDSELVAAPRDERPRLARQAAEFSEEDLTRFFQILMTTDYEMRHAPDTRLHLELGLLKLVNASRLAPLEEILAELRGEISAKPAASRAGSSASAGAPPSTRGTSSAATPNTSAPGAPSARAAASAAAAAGASATNATGAGATATGTPSTGATGTGASSLSSSSPVPASPPRIVAKAAESGAGGLAAAQVEAIKAALQGQQKFLWSLVEHVTRWELDGGEMRLYFPTESRALAEILQARDPMEKLRNVLAQVVGQPLRVCVKLDSSRPGMGFGSELRSRFEEDPIVRAMLERFGGRISDIKRRSEE